MLHIDIIFTPNSIMDHKFLTKINKNLKVLPPYCLFLFFKYYLTICCYNESDYSSNFHNSNKHCLKFRFFNRVAICYLPHIVNTFFCFENCDGSCF